MKSIKEIFGIKESVKQSFKNPERQSVEQTEDYATKKVVNTQEGTVEKVPVNGNDIVNKTYSDGGSGDKFLLNTGDTGTGDYAFDTSTLKVDATNHRVGVGTATPTYNLDVVGAGGAGVRTIISALQLDDGAGHAGARLSLVSNGWNEWGFYVGDPTNNSNKLFYTAASLTIFRASTNGIRFADTNFNALMTILNVGNVGIGTTSPGTKLTIAGNVNIGISNYYYIATSSSADTVNDIRLSASGGALITQKCTVANGTKGGGTWV